MLLMATFRFSRCDLNGCRDLFEIFGGIVNHDAVADSAGAICLEENVRRAGHPLGHFFYLWIRATTTPSISTSAIASLTPDPQPGGGDLDCTANILLSVHTVACAHHASARVLDNLVASDSDPGSARLACPRRRGIAQ